MLQLMRPSPSGKSRDESGVKKERGQLHQKARRIEKINRGRRGKKKERVWKEQNCAQKELKRMTKESVSRTPGGKSHVRGPRSKKAP